MEKGRPTLTGVWEKARKWPGPDQENLDRALVAGLLLETILDAPEALDHGRSRDAAVKTRLKYNLATQLAGRISLDHFRTLIRNLEHWFSYYYPLVASALAPAASDQGGSGVPGPPEVLPALASSVLREDELADWLASRGHEILPHRPHRKLHPAKLPEFLRRTRGGWFRIKDFEAHFGIDRKTAWEYLQKLRAASLLCHNGARAAAVRYCLADRFLLVRAGALRQKTVAALADWPRTLALELADRLIATGGAAFWEDRFQEPVKDPERRRAMVSRLAAAGVLQVAVQTGRHRMLRLSRAWLQNYAPASPTSRIEE